MSHSIGVVAPAHKANALKERDRMAQRKTTPAIDRIERRCVREDRGYVTPCLIFTGCTIGDRGYGRVVTGSHTNGTRRHAYVHRYVYAFYLGDPGDLQLDHLCRQRDCCDLTHLEPVTQRENGLRGMSPPALHARKTHCAQGHPFSEENTYLREFGNGVRRVCKACRREGMRRYYYQSKRESK